MGLDALKKTYSLEEILTDKQINMILNLIIKGQSSFEVIGSEIRPAADGICGFLGDHIRATLHVRLRDDDVRKIHLFIKRLPKENQPKADFIEDNNYFKREMLMFQLLKEMKGAEGPNPWCVEAYIYTESMIVMPDLSAAHYTLAPLLHTLDLDHVLLTAASLARFHAAFTNLETNRSQDLHRPYNLYKEYSHILSEPTFRDTPWTHTAAKLSTDLINAFSTKFSNKILDLQSKLKQLYVAACDSFTFEESTLNVLVHKDLWINNILYKYEGGRPTNCLLIDYQCIRYGPPTFDLTSFIYLNTTRSFRAQHERAIFDYYFRIFFESLLERSRKRLDLLGYDENEFLRWCEKSRMFGLFFAIGIFPMVLMDSRSADAVFNDPETYWSLMMEDRTSPVLQYANTSPQYKQRQLEVTEEFIERYVLGIL